MMGWMAPVRHPGARMAVGETHHRRKPPMNEITTLEAAVAALEKQRMAWHKSNPASQPLATIPGIGPIIATAIAATVVQASGFRSGRQFAAWLGLVPRQHSTGGKAR